MKLTKFATQVDQEALKELRLLAKEKGQTISNLVTEAIREYLKKSKVRPAFASAMDEVLEDHQELLKRLAK